MERRENVSTYVRFKGNESFRTLPFNEVDALIFAIISYLDFRGVIDAPIRVEDAYKKYMEVEEKGIDDKRPHKKTLEERLELFYEMSRSHRFKDVILEDYVDEYSLKMSEQFSVTTFRIAPFKRVIAFRGTDDSLAGWKENWEMIYKIPVSGQQRATDYVNSYVNTSLMSFMDEYYLVGHSKGGNLAVYAGLHLQDKVFNKVKGIYSFDGPGFRMPLDTFKRYKEAKPIIHSYTPSFSVIGMSFEYYHKDMTVESFGEGIGQHMGTTWMVEDNHFVESTRIEESKEYERLFKSWLAAIPMDEREEFVQTLFEVLEKTSITVLEEFLHLNMKTMVDVLKAMSEVDPKKRALMIRIISLLVAKSTQPKVERIGNAVSVTQTKILDKIKEIRNV